MCGIAGIVRRSAGAAPTLEALAAMAGALRHRGPDEFGLYRDDRAGLAHSRLSIIDLASGQQPLTNERGTLWITFNGEIFNYVELREELLCLGHQFRTKSDTEVIVHAYEQWGADAFRRLNGQNSGRQGNPLKKTMPVDAHRRCARHIAPRKMDRSSWVKSRPAEISINENEAASINY